MGSGGGVAWEYGQGNCMMWSKVLVVKPQRCGGVENRAALVRSK